jgi:uncharacterized protein (DUF58 family)
VDTGLRRVREAYALKWRSHSEMMNEVFKKAGVDVVELETGSDYV